MSELTQPPFDTREPKTVGAVGICPKCNAAMLRQHDLIPALEAEQWRDRAEKAEAELQSQRGQLANLLGQVQTAEADRDLAIERAERAEAELHRLKEL